MVSFKILAGGYDAFIATYIFNAATSSLTLQSKSPTGPSPSWISQHPENCSILYAVNQVTGPGAVQSFSILPSGELTPALDTVSSGGSRPAFVTALSTGEVAVVNYASGNGRVIPTAGRGTGFNPLAGVVTFPVPEGENGQEGVSHPHMVLEVEELGEVWVPDLGADTIWRLKKDPDSGEYTIRGSIPQPKGSGPRHIAIHNNRLFVVHELSSTLSVQTLPTSEDPSSTTLATISTTPSGPPDALWAAAEILIPPPTPKFPTPYIYISNRNKNGSSVAFQPPLESSSSSSHSHPTLPPGDTIAIFQHTHTHPNTSHPSTSHPTENLQLIKHVYTGLNQIRGMMVGKEEDGSDEWL
ncbi:hypothetical protein CVT26_004151, partial [Gymnopilus dilepis]